MRPAWSFVMAYAAALLLLSALAAIVWAADTVLWRLP